MLKVASNSGAVVGVGLAIALGAVLVASAFFPLATVSLSTSADGSSLEPDARSTLAMGFVLVAGSVGLFVLAARELPQERGWAIAALAGGAGVGLLVSQTLQSAAISLAQAPLHNGGTTLVWPYSAGVALVGAVGIGAAVTASVRGWSVGAASAWAGCALAASVGVALAVFSAWVLSSASQLRALAASRSRDVPGFELVVALGVIGLVAILLKATRGRSSAGRKGS